MCNKVFFSIETVLQIPVAYSIYYLYYYNLREDR